MSLTARARTSRWQLSSFGKMRTLSTSPVAVLEKAGMILAGEQDEAAA